MIIFTLGGIVEEITFEFVTELIIPTPESPIAINATIPTAIKNLTSVLTE